MIPSTLGAFIDVDSGVNKSGNASPEQAHTRDKEVSNAPTQVELDEMPIGNGALYQGPTRPPATLQKNVSGGDELTDPTPNELESSRPSSPSNHESTGIVQSWNNPSINKWRLLTTFVMFFGQGLNDSAPGALLPYMEEYYHIGYAIVSMIFIANAVGFILAAFFVHAIDGKLGRPKTLMLNEVIVACGYIMMVFTPPFPVLVVGYFVIGFGVATTLALNNVYGANLARSTEILGFMHGSYGIGGIVAPIIATSMVSNGIVFSRFFFILLGIRVIAFFSAGWSFKRYENDGSRPAAEERTSKWQELKLALKNRTTLIGALFIFAYQGAEVSISGWVISFLINYRDSDAAQAGYVTAGFWGGITVGRFALSPLAPRVGEKVFTYALIVGAVAFQVLVWWVPNFIGNSVAVAFIGLLLGPIYPAAMVVFARLIPRQIQSTAIGFTGGAGSSGGAVWPFMTGLLAQVSGTWVLHPICIGLFVAMEVCWFGLPKVSKRRE